MKITLDERESVEVSYNGVVYVLVGNPEGKPQLIFSHVEDREKVEQKVKTRMNDTKNN